MRSFEPGTVVRLPFPYTDRPIWQHRPGLVVADFSEADAHGLAWVLMITSAQNPSWVGDVDVGDDFRAAGLPAPSVVRTRKITTVDMRDMSVLGRLPSRPWSEVREEMKNALAP